MAISLVWNGKHSQYRAFLGKKTQVIWKQLPEIQTFLYFNVTIKIFKLFNNLHLTLFKEVNKLTM